MKLLLNLILLLCSAGRIVSETSPSYSVEYANGRRGVFKSPVAAFCWAIIR